MPEPEPSPGALYGRRLTAGGEVARKGTPSRSEAPEGRNADASNRWNRDAGGRPGTAGGSIAAGWRTSTGAGGPPVVGGGAVWSLNTADGVLFAIDPNTGATLGSISVGRLPHFASPTLSAGQVFVGTMAGVTAVKS